MSTNTIRFRTDDNDGDSFRSRLDKLINIKKEEITSTTMAQCKDEDRRNKMVEICKGLISDENRGATHFISSVELGAKMYRTKNVVVCQTASKLSTNATLAGLNSASLDVAFTEKNMTLAGKYDSRLFVTVDPMVKLNGARTVVKADYERVIGYDVSPVWTLVSDPEWREAMKDASLLYVNEKMAESRPVIAAGNHKFLQETTYNNFARQYFLKYNIKINLACPYLLCNVIQNLAILAVNCAIGNYYLYLVFLEEVNQTLVHQLVLKRLWFSVCLVLFVYSLFFNRFTVLPAYFYSH